MKRWMAGLAAAVGAFALGGATVSQAAVVAWFQADMRPGSPALGWEYLWNKNGPIGNPANYSPLLPTTNSSYYYDADGVDGLPGAGEPAAYVYLGVLDPSRPFPGAPGGVPGHGYLQPGTDGIERFAIAAYTLASTGLTSIVASQLLNADESRDGLHLLVYAGNDALPQIDTYTAPGQGNYVTFDTALGWRTAGDTIYVAVGANGDDFFDTFRLSYSRSAPPGGS